MRNAQDFHDLLKKHYQDRLREGVPIPVYLGTALEVQSQLWCEFMAEIEAERYSWRNERNAERERSAAPATSCPASESSTVSASKSGETWSARLRKRIVGLWVAPADRS
jgi:hypothetical protein